MTFDKNFLSSYLYKFYRQLKIKQNIHKRHEENEALSLDTDISFNNSSITIFVGIYVLDGSRNTGDPFWVCTVCFMIKEFRLPVTDLNDNVKFCIVS